MFETLRSFHRDASLTILLSEGEPQGLPEIAGARVLGVHSLLEGREGMIAACNPPGALALALLPHLMRDLLDGDGRGVLYLGAGMRICGPLTDLEEAMTTHEIVLVARPRDEGALAHGEAGDGAFSRQLIGMRSGQRTSTLLDAWPSFFAISGDEGAAAVRAWLDGVPARVDGTFVVRDPGYGLDRDSVSRTLTQGGDDERITVSGAELRAIDLGDLDPREPRSWLKEGDRAHMSRLAGLVRLLEAHAGDLHAAGLTDTTPSAPYLELQDGLRLTDTIRSMLVRAVLDGRLSVSPFTSPGRTDLYRYLNEPDERARSLGLTRLHMEIWDRRAELRDAYPHIEGPDGEGYAGWLCVHGPQQEGLVRDLLPRAPEQLYRDADPHISLSAPSRGVNVVGFFTSELGVGEVARLLVAGLDAVDVPALPVSGQLAPPSRQGIDYPHVGIDDASFPVNLICINGDGVPVFAREAGRSFFEGRHTIAVWWWEVGDPPASWTPAYEFVDEVWVGSQHVYDAIAPTSPVPVVRFTLPVLAPEVASGSRSDLGLPADGFLFLYVHDYHSVAARKNPLGLIDAFSSAFAPGSGATLVLKSINADTHPAEHEELLLATGGRPDIVLVDGYVSAQEKNAIIAACDCYVSLHRSEGFGLTIAEAMLLGKPVIATAYGGSLEFMNEKNSFLVDWEPTAVGEGAFPYAPDAVWADPDLDHASALMRRVFSDRADAAARAALARREMLERHSAAAAGAIMESRLSLVRERLAQAGVRSLNLTHLSPLELDGKIREKIDHAPAFTWNAGRLGPLKSRLYHPVLKWVRAFTEHQAAIDIETQLAVKQLDQRLTEVVRTLQDEQNAHHAETLALLRRLTAQVEGIRARPEGAGEAAPPGGGPADPHD